MTGGPRGTSPPLDLKAVEARLTTCSIAQLRTDTVVLLALLRETRAALQEAKGVVGWFAMQREQEWSRHYIELEARIAAVLGAAQDGPAG